MKEKSNKRGWNQKIKTHCPQGHPYSGSNLLKRYGQRYCLECQNTFWKKNPLHSRLMGIRTRCRNKKRPNYKDYGGRGIKCFLLLKDMRFLWERDKAYNMKCPSIDRIDVNGHYDVKNCRFVERSENNRFKRCTKLNYEIADEIKEKLKSGKTTLELCKQYGVSRQQIYKVKNGKAWNKNQEPRLHQYKPEAMRKSVGGGE